MKPNLEILYRKLIYIKDPLTNEEALAIVKELIAARAVIEAIKIAKVASYVREEMERYEEECR